MQNVRYIDHTGDAGIVVQAASPVELFRDCAFAMFQIIYPGQIDDNTQHHTIALAAPDDEQLLVNWLSELNYLFHTRQFLLSSISRLSISGPSLAAAVTGDLVDRTRYGFIREIKAVTYHQLYIKKINELWEAQVIFDL
ncbi:MAG TPA: archease [bacterium]|nr:archease [bacterium]HPN45135.1 archease [bacterium]